MCLYRAINEHAVMRMRKGYSAMLKQKIQGRKICSFTSLLLMMIINQALQAKF